MVATSVSASVPQRIDCLEGIRALAAVGVLITHVHFQTASGPVVLERFDYFVAVFFALSAFLLWRRPIGPGFFTQACRARITRLPRLRCGGGVGVASG